MKVFSIFKLFLTLYLIYGIELVKCDDGEGVIGAIAFVIAVILLPAILFSVTTNADFYLITPSNCDPAQTQYLPPAAAEYYGATEGWTYENHQLWSNTTTWYFGDRWDVYLTAGVCPWGGQGKYKQKDSDRPTYSPKFCLRFDRPDRPNVFKAIDDQNKALYGYAGSHLEKAAKDLQTAKTLSVTASICGYVLIPIFLGVSAFCFKIQVYFAAFFCEIILFVTLFCMAGSIFSLTMVNSEMKNPKAWAAWFPSCDVRITQGKGQGGVGLIYYQLISMGLFIFLLGCFELYILCFRTFGNNSSSSSWEKSQGYNPNSDNIITANPISSLEGGGAYPGGGGFKPGFSAQSGGAQSEMAPYKNSDPSSSNSNYNNSNYLSSSSPSAPPAPPDNNTYASSSFLMTMHNRRMEQMKKIASFSLSGPASSSSSSSSSASSSSSSSSSSSPSSTEYPHLAAAGLDNIPVYKG